MVCKRNIMLLSVRVTMDSDVPIVVKAEESGIGIETPVTHILGGGVR